MTIRHHLQAQQLPPVILPSLSVNYTNHFIQDGMLGCKPRNHFCICICRIHEQVNQVSQELIQVALIQGQAGYAPGEHASLQRARVGPVLLFKNAFIAPTTSCLRSSPACLSVLQLSNYDVPELFTLGDQLQSTTCQNLFLIRENGWASISHSHYSVISPDSSVCTVTSCSVI